MDLMADLAAIPAIGPLIPYLTLAVTISALVATQLPPPAQGAGVAYRVIYGAINALAANHGHAKNATAPSIKSLFAPRAEQRPS